MVFNAERLLPEGRQISTEDVFVLLTKGVEGALYCCGVVRLLDVALGLFVVVQGYEGLSSHVDCEVVERQEVSSYDGQEDVCKASTYTLPR